MSKVKVMYLTSSGLEWLVEVLEVSSNDYKEKIDNYISKNADIAARLEYKWNMNGENVTLGIDLENINTPQQLFISIENYVNFH